MVGSGRNFCYQAAKVQYLKWEKCMCGGGRQGRWLYKESSLSVVLTFNGNILIKEERRIP